MPKVKKGKEMNQEIRDFINKATENLPVGQGISCAEAERRAGQFLEVCAKIADWRHILTEGKIGAITAQSVTYAEELSKATGKTVTENKITVEASPAYTGVREELEFCENDIAYLKAMETVFLNGHLFYRNLSKGDN
jgi:hypothetical protein